ncbi:AraC family transcriptional regulator [Paenibacillus radicis (ex Gao et al. 2016)]|nr:ABC transporter substrate-binding protein [Paenibacillus radicis (ex Gao et al. 2016)]
MKWPEMIRRMSQTPIKLLDIRHIKMKPGEKLQSYRFPSSAFLFTNQGEASLSLDGVETSPSNNQLLHGAKGALLNISCFNRPFDYYLIFYKPVLEHTPIQVPYEAVSSPIPFMQSYMFQAKQPWALLSLLEQMHMQWKEEGDLTRLQVTGLFYQFLHEQFRQLLDSAEESETTDLAEGIARYIQDHYRQAISMETLANLFHYSSHYLSRVFKRKYECSPLEFLVQTRMNRAKALLAEEDVAVRDIAESVGYTDMYYFNRLFKKQTGITPAQFKMHKLGMKSSISTNFMPKSFIESRAGTDYIVNKDNHYQYKAWDVDEMNASFKPTFAVALLFSLSLLLAACGGAATNEKQGAQGNNQQQNEQPTDAPSKTKTITDGLGRQVEIPAEPSAAVVISYGGYLLPLGLKPVGVDQTTLTLYPDDMAGVASIGEGLGEVEAIAALQPDLIILPDFYSPDIYEKYQKIAPTVAVAWGGDPDVVNTLRTIGDVMNKKEEAEAWIAKFEEKLQRIRDQIDVKIKPGTTAATFILYKGEVLLGGEGGTLGKLIYKDFGFQMPEQFKQYADGGTALQMEALVDRPADYFFTQMTDEEMGPMTELFSGSLYQAVPAIKNNRVINVTRDKWNYGPYLVDEAVDEFVQKVMDSQK